MTTKTLPAILPGGRIIIGLSLVWLYLSAAAATPGEIQALMAKGKLERALATAEAGLEQDAGNIEMRFLKGLILTRLERFDAAEREFQVLIEAHPKLPEPYNNLAVVYAAQGDYEKARQTLLKAINTHPSYATAYENIGDIYAKMASDAYNQALQLDTDNTAAREKLALVNDLFFTEQISAAPTARPALALGANAEQQRSRPVDGSKTGGRSTAPPAEAAIEPSQPITDMPGPVMSTATTTAERPAQGQPRQDSRTAENAPQPAEPQDQAPARKQPDTGDIVAAVRGWAAAWSEQDVEAYLDYYADSFLPPAGMSREDWDKQRRERLTEPAFIKVSIDNIRVNTLGSDHAQVRFSQDYQSNTYSDSVIKTLLMKQAGDRWLIAEEHSG